MKNNLKIEVSNTQDIHHGNILQIAELEQDMWARDIGEYIQCNNCSEIYSKHDMYSNIPQDIYYMTTKKIEEILGIKEFDCKKCGADCDHIYGEEYVSDIESRYKDSESYLVVCKDNQGVIRGFMDGYIDDFTVVYNREFKHYYNNLGIGKVKRSIEKTLGGNIPGDVLSCSSLGLEEGYKNFYLILHMMKEFFCSIDQGNRDILGMSEIELGSNLHLLHSYLGSQQVGLIQYSAGDNKNNSVESDIFINPNLIQDYKQALGGRLRDFLVGFSKSSKMNN